MISYYTSIDNCICKIDDAQPGCWVNVIDPEPEEINILRNKFGVDEEYIRSSLDDEESARIENENGDVFLIYDVPYAEREENDIVYYTMPVGIIVKPQYIISVALKDNPVIMDFAQGVVKNVKTSFKTNFVLQMLFRMSTRFLQYLKALPKRWFITAFSGMAQGLFVTLIAGTILAQIAGWIGSDTYLGYLLLKIANIAKSLMGVGIGVGIAHALGKNKLLIFSDLLTFR